MLSWIDLVEILFEITALKYLVLRVPDICDASCYCYTTVYQVWSFVSTWVDDMVSYVTSMFGGV